MVSLTNISSLKQSAASGPLAARLHAQIEAAGSKKTRDQKPYLELVLVDASDRMVLRVWSDHPHFRQCSDLATGDFIEVVGEYYNNVPFGLDARQWTCRRLDQAEIDHLLAGPPEVKEKQQVDYAFIMETVETLQDPRLLALSRLFLHEHGERFRRTAAARNYHHARRGGLVEHTAQMMRTALVVAQVYPILNRDLLVAGVLFHDSGKLWENHLPADGFAMPYNLHGELMGHIPIGLELVNALWRKLLADEVASADWQQLAPPSDHVRLHLLHLIGSHHGSMSFGSPVEPKTIEAHALHYIDNLDAKMEMLMSAYQNPVKLAPNIFERVRPLTSNIVAQLPVYESPAPAQPVPDQEEQPAHAQPDTPAPSLELPIQDQEPQ